MKLKEDILNKGIALPCGGTGVCGRCKIICPALPISRLDKKFLTDKETESGIRLACDKDFCNKLNYEILFKTFPKQDFDYANIEVTIKDNTASVTLLNGEEPFSETTVINFLKEDSLSLYKGKIIKEIVELLEAYAIPKANTIIFNTDLKLFESLFQKTTEVDTYLSAVPFMLPSEFVYLMQSIK
ncbi:MAG: hypothetical protein FWD49_00580 [Firmicutes bacterium]|nr:hypothetical protein [Bacillota bacterium]